MLQKFLQKPFYLLLVYIFIAVAVYYNTIGAGMVFDFNGWTMLYQTESYKNVLNSFGYPGLHQMEQLVFFTLFKLFNFNPIAWYIVFAVLHAVSSFIAFQFLWKWLDTLNINSSQLIAFLSASLFLISPLAADVVVNKVTIHYLMSDIFIYSALYFLVFFYNSSQIKHIVYTFLFFVLALFSLEISYVFPVLYMLVWISLFYFNHNLKWSKKLVYTIAFPFIIILLFLLLHKAVVGSFIGHYGSEVHTNFNLVEIYSTVIRYFASYTLLFDYWTYKYKAFATAKLVDFSIVLFPLTVIVGVGITIFAFVKKKKNIVLIIFVFTLALVSLAPIANLYYAFMFPIENDRYGYLTSLFMYLLIVLLLFQIDIKTIRWTSICLFFILNGFFLFRNTQVLSKSSKITWGLLNDFRWFDKEVIMLTDPDNFGGAKMFSTIIEPTSFSESLFLHTGVDRRENIRSVYQMNNSTLLDSVKVKKISDSHYRVEMAQWGTWFMKEMIGATAYENDWCKTEIDKTGMNYYNLYLKNDEKDVVFIYSAGDKWTEVK